MRVLVVNPDGSDHTVDTAVLEAAGHTVVHCDDDSRPHACKGTPGGPGCPLDGQGVDVAVAAGNGPHAPMGVDGVRCVVRHFVPLVTLGPTASPASSSSTDGNGEGRVMGGAAPAVHAAAISDLPSAVDAAAALTLVGHDERATAEFRHVLAHHGLAADGASVVVRRSHGGLRVELCPIVPIDKKVAHAAAVRVAAALRAYDSTSHDIGVVLDLHALAPPPTG
jgi:hypothetical protein